MTEPTYTTTTVPHLGRRHLVTCPQHGRLNGHWPEREMAERAWSEHVYSTHEEEGE